MGGSSPFPDTGAAGCGGSGCSPARGPVCRCVPALPGGTGWDPACPWNAVCGAL